MVKMIPLAVAFTFVGAVWSAFAMKGPDSHRGMALYKEHCKACHIAGKQGGALTPISKTQAQWLRFFDKNRHRKQPGAWSNIPAEDLQDIRQWLHDHAADSDRPETCG